MPSVVLPANADVAIDETLRRMGIRDGQAMKWSASHLIRFVAQSLYRDLPALYCCYLNDECALLKIELIAVGRLEKMSLRESIIARRAQSFDATGIVLGFSDADDLPVAASDVQKLRAVARNLDDLGITLIELVRLSGSTVERIRLI